MFPTNTSSSQNPTSSGSTTGTTDRSTQQQSSYNPSQQQSSSQGIPGSSSTAQTSQQKGYSQPTRVTEPYPTQDSTWWEEAPSPNPHRTEQGYGHGGMMGGTSHGQQQQYGEYGGRSRDDKRARENQGAVNWNKVAKIICAIFLPPLGVFLETGCDKSFAINVLLTILGYLPGIIHAVYVIFMD